jgi:hypothetical protein
VVTEFPSAARISNYACLSFLKDAYGRGFFLFFWGALIFQPYSLKYDSVVGGILMLFGVLYWVLNIFNCLPASRRSVGPKHGNPPV